MNNRASELKKLREAFDTLNISTGKLGSAYDELKSETARINRDLEEHRRFLSDILDNLNCAVVVTSLDGAVRLSNPEARRLGVDTTRMIKTFHNKMVSIADSTEILQPKIEYDMKNGVKLAVSVSCLHTEKRENAGFIFVIEDQTELARLRKQTQRADRLAAIGKMAADMAHEVRNPLGGMEIFASLLERELEGDDEKLKLLNHVTTGIHSINNVISNFLLFTTDPKPVRKEFDLRKLVLNVIEFTGRVFEQNNILAKTDIQNKPMPVTADENLIRQVLLNMIQNAINAMPEGGEFTITAKDVKSNGRVEITCSDTGPGVAENIREKIFDPFFTTKQTGAGLGLSIVSQVLQAHGGYVDILETGADGTKFIMAIPYN